MYTTVNNTKSCGLFKHYGEGKAVHAMHFLSRKGFNISFQCHNVTIMKNAQGDRVIIQEVK